MIFGVAKVMGGHCPEIASHLNVGICRNLQAPTPNQTHRRVGDRFCCQAVRRAGFQSKGVAFQMKRTDLAASVIQKLAGTNGTTD